MGEKHTVGLGAIDAHAAKAPLRVKVSYAIAIGKAAAAEVFHFEALARTAEHRGDALAHPFGRGKISYCARPPALTGEEIVGKTAIEALGHVRLEIMRDAP